jgi:hypothetical protein
MQHARGFSLVETLIATALMAGALVSLAQFIGTAAQSGAAARTRASAALMAGQKIEELRVVSWTDLAVAPAGIEYLDRSGHARCPDMDAPCGDAVFVRRWSITPAPFSAAILIVEVDVRPVGKGHGFATLVTARGRMAP